MLYQARNRQIISDGPLREKYFPGNILNGATSLADDTLIKQFPLRYELFQRESTGVSLCRSDMRFFEQSDLGRLNNLQRYLGAHTAGEGTLRHGQLPVFKSLVNFFEQGLRSGFVVVPTRGGKTVIFVELVENSDTKTLVLVPTKDLVTQTKNRFTEFAPLLDVGVHYGKRKEGLDHQVVISTYDTWMSLVKNGTLKPGDFPLMILDEGHEILSQKKSLLIEPFLEHDTVIGFTATDKYSEKRSLQRHLHNLIHRMSIKEAVQLELITPFSVITAETDISLSPVRTDFATGDYNLVDLSKTLRQSTLTKSAIELYRNYFDGRVGIISCCDVNHAKEVAHDFSAAGIPATAVYGKMDDSERQLAIDGHQAGTIKILTTAKLLTGGYDNALASFIFNLFPTMSLKLATQRGGRPLTLNPNEPDKVGEIVEFLHPDENKRRRQMTFLDATHCASLPGTKLQIRKTKSTKSGKGKDPKTGELKVTFTPEGVEDVIREHSQGHQEIRRKTEHSTDKLNLEIKALHLQRQKILLSLGAATMLLHETYAKRKIAPKQECAELLKVAAAEAQERFQKIASKPMDSRRVAQLAVDNREVLAHIERKFRGDGLTISDMTQLRHSFKEQRERLISVLDELKDQLRLPNIEQARTFLAHADQRCSDHTLSPETLRGIDQKDWEKTVRKQLKTQIKPIEKAVLARWDTFLDAMADMDRIDAKLRELHRPLLRAAREIVKEEVRPFEGRTLGKKELLQEGWSLAIPLIDQFIFEGTRNRFSTHFTKQLRKGLFESVESADKAALNVHFTDGYKKAAEAERKNEPSTDSKSAPNLLHFRQGVTFFSELDYADPKAGEEITEDDYDIEESIHLAEESIGTTFHLSDEERREIQADEQANGEESLRFSPALEGVLKTLTYREREILRARFIDQETFEEVGKHFGITKERVRQIEFKAIRKIQGRAYTAQQGHGSPELREHFAALEEKLS